MTAALQLRFPARTVAAPAVWSGRVLNGVVGAFLAVEGLGRLAFGRGLVAPSDAAPLLDPAVQSMLAAVLVLGAVLLAVAWTRLAGLLVLTLGLAGLIASEARADVPSSSHVLFWAYVAGLTWVGALLRRLRLP
jgi:hypothetical protein